MKMPAATPKAAPSTLCPCSHPPAKRASAWKTGMPQLGHPLLSSSGTVMAMHRRFEPLVRITCTRSGQSVPTHPRKDKNAQEKETVQWADGARSEEGYTEATLLLKDGKDSYNVSLNSDGTSMLEDSVRKKHCIVGFEHVVHRGPTGFPLGNVSIVLER